MVFKKGLSKKARNKKAVDNEPVHAMVEHSISIRKALLKAAIDSTHLLKACEEIKSLRNEKIKKIQSLYSVLDDARKTLSQLKRKDLPSIEKKKPSEKPKIPAKEKIMVEKKKKEKKPLTEIDKLKTELQEMEGKLGKL